MKIFTPVFMTLLLLTAGFSIGNHTEKPDTYKYEATVLGKGIDCEDVFLIDLKSLGPGSEFEDEIYYADKLKPEFKKNGLKIILNCRKPSNDELYSCTCEGPGYSHLIVLGCEIVKTDKN